MKNFISVFIIFLYLYPIGTVYLPSFTSRVLLGILGLVLLSAKIVKSLSSRNLVVKKKLLIVYFLLFLLAAISIASMLYNKTNDSPFVEFSKSSTVSFLNCIFIISILSYFKKNNEFILAKFIIIAVAFQTLLSLLIFLLPSFNDLIYSFIYLDTQSPVYIREVRKRIVGFGAAFFSAAVTNGVALILIGYLFRYSKLTNKDTRLLSYMFVFIFIIGLFMARSIIVGAILGLSLMLFPKSYSSGYQLVRKLKAFLLIILTPTFLIFTTITLFPSIIEKYTRLINFGFEFFINFSETGEAETASTERVIEMLGNTPNDLKTLIIGDGLWSDKFGGYYMNVDVGYLRVVYNIGILGLAIFILYHCFLIQASFSRRLVQLTLLFYLLIINIKGFADLTPFLALFFILNYNNSTTKHGKNDIP